VNYLNYSELKGGGLSGQIFTIAPQNLVLTMKVLSNTRGLSMKRIITLALISVFVLAMSAFAGEYHFGSSLSCYQCHTMHYSQQHMFGYAFEDSTPYLGSAGPYNSLLRDEVNNLCLSCHDGRSVVDVYGPSEVFQVTNRQAGFLNRQGDGNEGHGHTLGSTATAPGSNPAWHPDQTEGLTCVDCHSPHGSAGSSNPDQVKGQWRNLTNRPGNATTNRFVNYEKSTEPVDLTKDIKWRASSVHSPGAYETNNVDFYEPVANDSRYGAWCQGCHTNFHGNSTDPDMHNANGWIRHPAAEVNLSSTDAADFASHAYRPQVMSPTGNWGTQGDSTWTPPSDLTPTCVTCHKGHGNGNSFGLVYMTGRQPRSENGDATRITNTCKICHRQGGY
jgi:hypothetical protein